MAQTGNTYGPTVWLPLEDLNGSQVKDYTKYLFKFISCSTPTDSGWRTKLKSIKKIEKH